MTGGPSPCSPSSWRGGEWTANRVESAHGDVRRAKKTTKVVTLRRRPAIRGVGRERHCFSPLTNRLNHEQTQPITESEETKMNALKNITIASVLIVATGSTVPAQKNSLSFEKGVGNKETGADISFYAGFRKGHKFLKDRVFAKASFDAAGTVFGKEVSIIDIGASAITHQGGTKNGVTREGPFSRSVVCVCSMPWIPPMPDPMTTPIRSAFCDEIEN